MGRPKTGTDNNIEKALTRVICQEIFIVSGLNMAELEVFFGIGTVDAFGKKTCKTFSRYCESDPSKSRAASRDTLQRIVKMSLKRGWLDRAKIYSWGVQNVLALDHERATEIFEERKSERDALVKTLRELKEAVKKTIDLNRKGKFARAAKYESPENDDIWQTHCRLRHFLENEHYDPSNDSTALGDVIAPISLNGCLELLDICLEQTEVFFWNGDTARPQPDPKRLVLSSELVADAPDFSDIDALMEQLEKSMK